jgi:hypothetical protein
MHRFAYLACVSVAACATTGDDPAAADEQDSSTTQYVNIMDFASTDQGAWYDLVGKLNGEFATSGAHGITPLTFYCAVSSKLGSVKDCAWTFTAAQTAVDGKTAALQADAVTYQCHVHPKTTAVKLIALLQSSTDAIHATLPGTTGSIADALPDCFAHPIGGTPLTAATGPTYVEASDYYTSLANKQKWGASYAALELGFDNICGDTFCSGDFSDLQSLDFSCAITKSSGNVKSCAWTFGGSYTTVAKTGELALATKTWTCPVAVTGTIAQLIGVLTSTNTEDGVHRPLPGGTAAYDSIAGCVGR